MIELRFPFLGIEIVVRRTQPAMACCAGCREPLAQRAGVKVPAWTAGEGLSWARLCWQCVDAVELLHSGLEEVISLAYRQYTADGFGGWEIRCEVCALYRDRLEPLRVIYSGPDEPPDGEVFKAPEIDGHRHIDGVDWGLLASLALPTKGGGQDG